MLTGDNGIINNAKQAKNDTAYSQWEEKIDVAIIDAESKHRNLTIDDIIDQLIEDDIVDNANQIDKDTGDITTNSPSYVIEGKLKDYIKMLTVQDLKVGEKVYYNTR